MGMNDRGKYGIYTECLYASTNKLSSNIVLSNIFHIPLDLHFQIFYKAKLEVFLSFYKDELFCLLSLDQLSLACY